MAVQSLPTLHSISTALFYRSIRFKGHFDNGLQTKVRNCDEEQTERCNTGEVLGQGTKLQTVRNYLKAYVSHLLNNGFDQNFVREQVGHQMLQTTLNYYVYSTTRNTQKIERLNKVL